MIESLLEKLYENPADTVQRSVVADWYEENGQQGTADCHRWIARTERKPFYKKYLTIYWIQSSYLSPQNKDSNVIQDKIFFLLKGGTKTTESRYYKTIREAEDDLIQAYISIN